MLADGQPVALGARAFDLLVALMERRDRVVTKNELLDLAWPGLVVEEGNLAVQISTLRKLLGPGAITTVTGRGYRFSMPPAANDDGPAKLHAVAEPASRVVRRLAAIAYAEVIGWAAAVAADAAVAVAAWKAVRATLIEASAPAVGGRVIELAAEAVWLEFGSAVDALRWAIELQQRLAERPSQPTGLRLRMRMGISVDDVVVDDGKLFGEGVHTAARMLRVAGDEPIVVSDAVCNFVQQKLPVNFRPLGAHVLDSQARTPVEVFAVEALTENDSGAEPRHRLNWDHRPSVAVLPFATGGDTPEYFGDGITEEIIASLSANRALFVIARNSTLRYRSSTSSSAGIAGELGVRYLLLGSVRRFEQRLRINAELVDAAGERIIWAQHFEGGEENLFGFQAQIATSIAAAIDPRVQEAEMARVSGRPTDSLGAYDCVLRGLSVLYTFRGGDFESAGALLRRAIELDPNYAQAHAHLAWWHNLRVGEGRSAQVSEDGLQAERLSQRAVELDPRDAVALSVAGHVQSFIKRKFTVAMEMFDQALAINPSCAVAWARSATTLAYMGEGEEALQRVRNALRLSPFDPQSFSFCTTNGAAAIVVGRYDEAVGWLSKAHRLNPGYRAAWRLLIAALALSGERAESAELAREFVQTEPAFRVSEFGAWYPMREPHLAKVLDGMRLAGLPD